MKAPFFFYCGRGTRESTPCSLIRDPEIIRTPGSSNRPTSSMQNREAQISACSLIPTAHEIDKFFADTEEEQQRQFIEKYTTTFISPAFLYTSQKLLDCSICDIPSISLFTFMLADIRCGLFAGTTMIPWMISRSLAISNGRKLTHRRQTWYFPANSWLILSLGIDELAGISFRLH